MERLCRRARVRSFRGRIFVGELIGTCVATIITSSAGVQNALGSSGFGAAYASGIAICIGIIFAGQIAPLGPVNPNVAVAFTVKGDIKLSNLIFYVLGELAGGLLGHFLVYGFYLDAIGSHAAANFNSSSYRGIENAFFCSLPKPHASLATQICDPALSTFMLTIGILAIVDNRNFNVPDPGKPVLIGLHIIGLVNALALNTGAPMNSAMDFTGRVMSSAVGWGGSVWSAGKYFFWIPIVMPALGSAVAGIVYSLIMAPNLPVQDEVDLHPVMTENGRIQGDMEMSAGDPKSSYEH